MFLHYLTDAQCPAFLGLVRHMVLVDERFDLREWKRLDLMRAEMGLPAATPIPETNLATLALPFTTRRSQLVALLELISLGYSDEDFHPTEHSIIQELAAIFALETTDLLLLENWVLRQRALLQEAERLLTSGT